MSAKGQHEARGRPLREQMEGPAGDLPSVSDKHTHTEKDYCQLVYFHNVIFVFRKLELSLMLSVWVLYSIMVLGGRLSTRRSVSRMRAVVAWSLAVLFHIEIMSSYRRNDRKNHQSKSEAVRRVKATCESRPARGVAYLKPDRDHSPTDLLPNHELFPQHGQDEILPATGCQALPQPNNPLATIFICIIL